MQPLCCLIGTRAQFIKMAPVLLELEARNIPYRLLMSGQHSLTMDRLQDEFSLSTTAIWLYQGREVSSLAMVLPWAVSCLWRLLRNSQYLPDGTPLLLTHGDTFSTLLSALVGRLRKIPVAHVESGLRSFRWWHPFPEELTRRCVFHLARIAFCQDEQACDNLAALEKLRKINTGGNTLIDALHLALKKADANTGSLAKAESMPDTVAESETEGNVVNSTEPQQYALVSLHRFENIFFRRRLSKIIDLLEVAARHSTLLFVLHPATEKNLHRFGLIRRLQNNGQIKLVPRLSYIPFVRLLQQARFVITDGGGNQEELSYLQIPTLLMRVTTERQEGLGATAFICNYDLARLQAFLRQLPPANVGKLKPLAVSPSKEIVDAIEQVVGYPKAIA